MSQQTEFRQGQLTVSDLMSHKPATVPAGTMLVEVAEVLSGSRYQHVFVSDTDGRVVGVISSNDLLHHVADTDDDGGSSWKRRTVESIMSTKFVTSSPAASADDVAPMIVHGSIDCVPVLECDKLVGVLTSDDLLLSWNRLDPLLRQAASDAVTNLANRTTFNRRLTEEWNRARRQHASLGLIIIDIDYFKAINDSCGHTAGDAVLNMIGCCLKRHLRTYDVVARWAGDEFVALCCECLPEDIDLPIRRVQNAVRQLSIPSEQGRRSVTLSIGAAVIRQNFHLATPEALLERADECLYLAKREGRDRAYRAQLGSTDSSALPVLVEDQEEVPAAV